MTPGAILPLVVHDLCYEIGGKHLLDGISFRTDAGPRTVVLGPNGAGKSLLLRLCHGLLQPSGGTIAWAGATPEMARRCQAMVFQRPVLLRRSTAANITYVLRLQGLPRRQRRAMMWKRWSRPGCCRLRHNRRASCQVGSSSASPWHVPGPSSPRCCSLTNQLPALTRRQPRPWKRYSIIFTAPAQRLS